MREDLLYLDKINELVEVDKIKFNNLICIYSNFLHGELHNIKFDSSFIEKYEIYFKYVEDFFVKKNISKENFDQLRFGIWREYDGFLEKSNEKLFLRALVVCFYDEIEPGYTTSDILDLIFSVTFDINSKLCEKLFNFFTEKIK